MMARRLPTILPDLSFEEALEITKIHSIAGTLPSNIPLITTRPFRAPHHTVSAISLTGGGKVPKPRRNKPSTFRSIIFRRTTRVCKKHTRGIKSPSRRRRSNNK